jgi:tetratricopeptide (TPR) repeat protein
MEESKDYLERARALAQQRRAAGNLALFTILAGYRCMLVKEFEQARELLVQARVGCEDLGWNLGAGVAIGMLGGICVEYGELDRAEMLLEQAEEAVSSSHRDEDLALIQVFKGRLALKNGKLDEARVMLSRGMEFRDMAGFREKSGVGQALQGLAEQIEAAG